MKNGSVKFDSDKVAKRLFEAYAEEQTKRLIAYASETIGKIGAQINTYHSKNQMDRTHNLLDSLCWGVSYKGEIKGSGFYREQQATTLSYLHEWSGDKDSFPVGGHTLATNFIQQMSHLKHNGWRVFFAILAPYWGYWEQGFHMKERHSGLLEDYDEDDVSVRGRRRFLKFAVMTEFYDKVSRDLKPATTKFKVTVPDTTNPRVRAKRAAMRDYRQDRNLGSPYDMYKGKYSFDKDKLSRRHRT